jgi:hypothetical protein
MKRSSTILHLTKLETNKVDLFKELQDTVQDHISLIEDEAPAAPKKIMGNTDFFRKFTNHGSELKQLSNRDAADIIQQAHDSTEEIDTVAFGLETNEGEVVKVYINAEQADDFEKAMADMLGQEDDIEAAIDKMAQSFDIVSVEWPEDRNGGQPLPSEEAGDKTPDSIVPAENEEAEDEQSALFHKVKLNFSLNDKEESDDDSEEEKDPEDDSEESKDDSEEGDIGFTGDDDEEDKKDDSEEEKDPKNGSKKKVKKTPPKKKVEEQLSIGARVKARFLREDNNPAKKNIETKKTKVDKLEKDTDKDEKKSEKETTLDDIFKTPMQRKLFRLVMLLDFPVQRLITYKQEFRSGIRIAAIDIVDNSKCRLFLNKLIKELESNKDTTGISDKEASLVKAHKKADLQESKNSDQQELLNKQIALIIELLSKIGVPESAINIRETALKQNLRETARLFLRHAKLQNYLATLNSTLTKEDDSKDEVVTEEVALGADQYAKIVSKLLTELGVPDDNLSYQRSNLSRSLREKSLTIDLGAVKPRMIQLIKLLAGSQVQEQLINEVDLFVKQHSAKLGNWSIAKLDKRVSLSVEDISIELSPSQTEKLVNAFQEGESVTVKSGAHNYKFKVVNNGKEYVVFLLDAEEHEHGVLFSKSSVKTLLNQF